MSPSLSLPDAETGNLPLDWIVLTAMILGTALSVLGLRGADIPLTRAGALPCADAASMACHLR